MADLLTFIDIQTQVQTAQQTASAQNNNSESGQGFFDSLITEYTTPEIQEQEAQNVQLFTNETLNANLMNFKGGKLFSSSVMEMLTEIQTPENPEPSADALLNNFEVDDVKNLFAQLKNSLHEIKTKIEEPEVFYNDEDMIFNEKFSELINMSDEELSQKLENLSEDVKPEVQKIIEDIINNAKNSDENVKQDIMKLSGILNNKTDVKTEQKNSKSDELIPELEADEDKKEKTDEAQEPKNDFINAAGTVEVQNLNVNDKSQAPDVKPEKDFLVNDDASNSKNNAQNLQQTQRTLTREVHNDASKADVKNNSEDVKPETKFNKILENREISNENQNGNENENNFSNGSNNNEENQNQNFNQPRENFSQNSSRSRNDTRKTSNEISKAQNEKDFANSNSNSTTKTNSHNNFQSFFEGVLNNRRVSTTSPQPLNLRDSLNFNRSETLRNGVVNVVRFIRADGVQRANIVIDPPALGRISVELTSSTSGMEASIKVASEQIRQLVQVQLSQLRMNLSEQGVQVAEFTVDVQQDSQQNSGNSQDNNQENSRSRFIGGVNEEEAEEEFRIDLEEGLLYWVA